MDLMLDQAGMQGVLGLWLGTLITWLRGHGFLGRKSTALKNRITLVVSYGSAFCGAVGIHFAFTGDMLTTGGHFGIDIPNLEHLWEGLLLFASNLMGQKGWAAMYKGTKKLSQIADALEVLARASKAKK